MCGHPGLLNSIQTPTVSHSFGPRVHTSSMICRWENVPEEKALEAGWGHLGRELQHPWCWKSGLGAWALNEHIPLAPCTPCLVGRPQAKGTSVKVKVRASLAKSKGSTREKITICPSVCLSTNQTHQIKVRVDIYPTLYSLQCIFPYNTLHQSSQFCTINIIPFDR